MEQISITGGARIGMSNATWPFATLKVTKDKLDLNATILGNLVFRPEDIISIEPYPGMMSGGIKINHRVSNYKDKVIFWTFKNPNSIINQIGFLDNRSDSANDHDSKIIVEKQKQGGFPVKIPFAVGIVAIWNILFLMDFLNFSKNDLGWSKAPPTNHNDQSGFRFTTSLILSIKI